MLKYDTDKHVHRITAYNTVATAHRRFSAGGRLVLHLDMNCFYAQVEQQSYNLYGIPLIIGGWRKPDGTLKGIVATASYEARKLGIRTAMSAFEAQQLCPFVVCLQIDYEKYRVISREIGELLARFSPSVEHFSMDEFFLDVSHWRDENPEVYYKRALEVKSAIFKQTGLVCSVGVARSKTYAKLASDLKKPDGCVVLADKVMEIEKVHPLALKEVWGIGPKRAEKLKRFGLNTIADVAAKGMPLMQRIFGARFGAILYETILGNDQACVFDEKHVVPKEVSHMHTFPQSCSEVGSVLAELNKAIFRVAYRMRGYRRQARVFRCEIRFDEAEWKGVAFEFQTGALTHFDDVIREACYKRAIPLLDELFRQGRRVRGLGLQTVGMTPSMQLSLFYSPPEKNVKRFGAMDAVNNRFGIDILKPAGLLPSVGGLTHFR